MKDATVRCCEWRLGVPAGLRFGLGRCTEWKGGKLASSPSARPRQASRGNIHESRQPKDGFGATLRQVPSDLLLQPDILEREPLLLVDRVPGAHIRMQYLVRGRGRLPNGRGSDFQVLRG